MGKVCLVGCESLRIDLTTRTFYLGELALAEGDVITLDGNDVAVYLGTVSAVMVPDQALLERLRALRKLPEVAHHRKHKK